MISFVIKIGNWLCYALSMNECCENWFSKKGENIVKMNHSFCCLLIFWLILNWFYPLCSEVQKTLMHMNFFCSWFPRISITIQSKSKHSIANNSFEFSSYKNLARKRTSTLSNFLKSSFKCLWKNRKRGVSPMTFHFSWITWENMRW